MTAEEKKAVEQKEMLEQNAKNASALANYIKENNLKPTKTASGLQYVITQKGSGANIQNGQTAVMNYTGNLLNGTKFDSNVDPAFNHVKPFEFPLGQGRVIKGWDEGVALLNKGSKALLIIPSDLGYGSRGQGKIPANSVLIFEVELVDIK